MNKQIDYANARYKSNSTATAFEFPASLDGVEKARETGGGILAIRFLMEALSLSVLCAVEVNRKFENLSYFLAGG